ncbi:alpha/beta-hydrolase [Amylostereum chailletii]|nr:alpha/beta-hydrolase [Amylostereum chailletii]
MEAISTFKDTAIPVIIGPTIAAFSQALESKRESIESVARKTFKYGPADRHHLDIYYPASSATKVPILFFNYGGGFSTGERAFPPPLLAYGNLGAYFAKQGFLTVIPDYTLVPPARYPEPAREIRDAIQWVVDHSVDVQASVSGSPEIDTDKIFVSGHSAGSVHVATIFLDPTLLEGTHAALQDKVKALILIGHPPDLHAFGDPRVLSSYYSAQEEILQRHPLGLLKNAPVQVLKSLPEILFVEGENEPPALLAMVGDFRNVVARGHNHISVSWALSSGQGEEWAEEATRFLKTK